MPNYWILKTDAESYPFDELRREGRTVWDGVTNPLALKHIRGMAQGDRALIYHSGQEKALVGLARIVSDPCGKALVKAISRCRQGISGEISRLMSVLMAKWLTE